MDKMLYVTEYDSLIGILLLAATDDGLAVCALREAAVKRRILERIVSDLDLDIENGCNSILDEAVNWLDNYFRGRENEKRLPLLLGGSPFQKKVWSTLLEIPYGTTVSYSQLANRIGNPKSVRAVANAVGANRLWIVVPCHRVIGANGSLTGYAGGLEAKRFLLSLESRG